MNPGELERRGGGMASALGRRHPNQSLAQVRKDLADVGTGLQAAYPDDYRADRDYALVGAPLRREFTRQFESRLILGKVPAGFVLLIVCASVANLAVARTMRRERELALRAALGASRRRLMRQLITESMILSLAGGTCGFLLAFVGMDLLQESPTPGALRRRLSRSASTRRFFSLRSACRS